MSLFTRLALSAAAITIVAGTPVLASTGHLDTLSGTASVGAPLLQDQGASLDKMARRGADDTQRDDRGGNRGGRGRGADDAKPHADNGAGSPDAITVARRGADDTQPDDRGGNRGGRGRGADDAKPHASNESGSQSPIVLARRGADDTQPDDRGGKRGGRG